VTIAIDNGRRAMCPERKTFGWMKDVNIWKRTLFSACTDLRTSFSITPSATYNNNEDEEEEIVSTYSRISPL
jgi:hypothetical protein